MDEPHRGLVSARPGGGDEEMPRARPPQIVEHDVDPGAEMPFENLLVRVPVSGERNPRVGAISANAVVLRPVAMTFLAPKCLAICTAKRPDACRAIDEHRFLGRQLGPLDEGDPGRHAGVGDGGRGHIIQPIGHGEQRSASTTVRSPMPPNGERGRTK